MQLHKHFIFGFVQLALVSALPWDGPKPTPASELDSLELLKRQEHAFPKVLGRSPAAIMEPRELVVKNLLAQRDPLIAATTSFSSALASASITPNNTCGYFSGSAEYPQWCDPSYTCAIATSQSVWGCCSAGISGCDLITSCVPHTDIASCAGNNACRGNNFLTQCDAVSSICNQQILIGEGNEPATNWYCDQTAAIFTVYATATDNTTVPTASFDFIQLTLQTFSSLSSAPASSTVSSTTASPKTPTSSTPAAPTTTQPTPTIGLGGFNTPTPSPSPTSSSKSTPIGAIVGGAVGGAAVIAAVIFGIWFCLRKKNSSPTPAPNPNPQFTQIQNPPPPTQVADAGAKGGANTSITYYPPPPNNDKELFLPGQNSPQSPESQFSQFGQGQNQPGNTTSYVAYSGSPSISPAPGYEQHQPVLYPQPPQGSELDGTGVNRA